MKQLVEPSELSDVPRDGPSTNGPDFPECMLSVDSGTIPTGEKPQTAGAWREGPKQMLDN